MRRKVYGIHILLDQEDWFSSSSLGQSLQVGNIRVINIQAEKTVVDIFYTHYQHSYSHQEGKVYIFPWARVLGVLDIVILMSIAHIHLLRTSLHKRLPSYFNISILEIALIFSQEVTQPQVLFYLILFMLKKSIFNWLTSLWDHFRLVTQNIWEVTLETK